MALKYAIFGAGDIGCTVGIALAASGVPVSLIGRDSPTGAALQQTAHSAGASVVHTKSRWKHTLSALECSNTFTTDVARLAQADVIMIATKRSQNQEAANAIAKHARGSCTIVLLQNGLSVADEIRSMLPEGARGVVLVECVVSMNAVRKVGPDGATFVWTSPRDKSNPAFMLAEQGAAVAAAMDGAGLIAASTATLQDVAHAKMILNCGMNAINALSGRTTQECLRDPGYRRLMLAAMEEVVAVYTKAGISYDKKGVLKFVKFARLPSPLVWLATALLLDASARSSMWSDLEHNRKTEVDYLNGLAAKMGQQHGVPTPINARLVER
eukprot:1702322-Prymnesium_polylepis.1